MKKIKSVNENLIRVESESDVYYDAVKKYLRCYQRLFSCSPKLPSKFLLTNLFMTHHQFHWYLVFFFFFFSQPVKNITFSHLQNFILRLGGLLMEVRKLC